MDFEAFRADRRHLGVLRASVRAAYYRVTPWASVRLFRFVVLTMATVDKELLRRSTRFEARLLTDEELGAFSEDPRNQLPPRFVRAALANGDLCFALLDGPELASFGWYSTSPTAVETSMTIRFDARYPYMYHGYTRPAYRGQNLHGIGLARAVEMLTARGHLGIVSLAECVNFASLRSCERVGFRFCGFATRSEWGGAVRLWTSPAVRPYGISMESHGAPLYEAVS